MPLAAASRARAASLRSGAALLVILALGLAVRGYGLGAKSFWYDEAVTWQTLNFDVPDLLERKADFRSVHPPLYFLILKPWAALWGESESALRSLALVFGVLTILGTCFFMRALWEFPRGEPLPSSTAVGLHAAALVAANPMQILNSQQVRGYSLATALWVWCAWALLRGLQPGTKRPCLLAVASVLAAALCYTNHIAALSVGALAVFAVPYLVFQRRGTSIPCRWMFAAGLLFVVLYAIPWLPRFVAQAEHVRSSPHLARSFQLLSLPANITRALLSTWGDRPSRDPLEVWTIAGALLALLTMLAVRCGWKGFLLAVTGLLPVLAIVAYSVLSVRTIVSARYFSFAQLSWLCAISFAIFQIAPRNSRRMCAGWSLLISVLLCGYHWRAIGTSSAGGIRDAARVIHNHRRPDEALIAADHRVFYGFKYYWGPRPGRPLLLVPSGSRFDTVGAENLADGDLVSTNSLINSDFRGVWIMTSEYRDADYKYWLGHGSYVLVERWKFVSDYFWEPPAYVEHYKKRRKRREPAH